MDVDDADEAVSKLSDTRYRTYLDDIATNQGPPIFNTLQMLFVRGFEWLLLHLFTRGSRAKLLPFLIANVVTSE